ncbi:MAG: putative metal-binding motif-containing protein [Pseudomonadota bacterium]|nr:putative metal-binding motif-containing protein [Pseudomonadota bacterium]
MTLLLACTSADPPGKPDTDTSVEADTDTDADGDTDTDSDTDVDTDTDTDSDTDLPRDADGDGYESVAVGGADCDDRNIWIYPGAVEYCDAVDQDCDGQPLAPGSCASAAVPEAAVVWIAERAVDWSGAYGMIGDVTGDEKKDLLWGFWPYDGVTIVEGGSMPPDPKLVPDDAWVYGELDSGGMFGGEALDVGDVDGDGVRDLGFVSHAWGGGIYVHLGPFAEGDVFSIALEQDLLWTGFPQDPENWAVTVVGGEDFDGDGGADVVLSNYAADYSGYDVDAHFSGEWDDHCPLGATGGSARPDLLGDVDGDGVRDLNVFAGGYAYILSGADVYASCGAMWDDFAIGWMDNTDSTARVSSIWSSIEDATGDGLEDVVAAAPASSTVGNRHGEVYFFSGAALRGEVFRDDALGSYVGDGDRSELGYRLFAADFDGDGVSDIVTSGGTPDSSFTIVPGGLPAALREPLPSRRLVWELGLSWSIPPGDFDGDDHADLWFIDVDTVGMSRLGIVQGFDVPWDDPTYW